MSNKLWCAAYYFPGYHAEKRNEPIHGPNWSEWELMKCSRPRFEGHQQPKVPLHGWNDESDPKEMAIKIDDAVNHGIDAFVFDWYWYDGPYLQAALDKGFLQATNRKKMKFALMWANHNWRNFHPGGRDIDYSVTFQSVATLETVETIWNYIIEHYLSDPFYWKVDGKLYFSIYSVNRFILQLGGTDKARYALDLLREKVQKRGLGELHINGIWFDMLEKDAVFLECPQEEWKDKLGIDSYTSYNSISITQAWKESAKTFPKVDYATSCMQYQKIAEKAIKKLPAPYYPVMTVGWDSTPRTIQSDTFLLGNYPWFAVMEPNVKVFEESLLELKNLINTYSNDSREDILFFNAWNEWSEGSYLEPDIKHGYAFLEAVKRVINK